MTRSVGQPFGGLGSTEGGKGREGRKVRRERKRKIRMRYWLLSRGRVEGMTYRYHRESNDSWESLDL